MLTSAKPVNAARSVRNAHAVGGLVPTPAGAGGVEAAMAALYGPLVPAGALAGLVVAWRLTLFYGPVALAAGAFALSGPRRPRHTQPPAHPTPRADGGQAGAVAGDPRRR